MRCVCDTAMLIEIPFLYSCLATLYGTPRVLQSIAAENTMPAIARLSEGVSIDYFFSCFQNLT